MYLFVHVCLVRFKVSKLGFYYDCTRVNVISPVYLVIWQVNAHCELKLSCTSLT